MNIPILGKVIVTFDRTADWFEQHLDTHTKFSMARTSDKRPTVINDTQATYWCAYGRLCVEAIRYDTINYDVLIDHAFDICTKVLETRGLHDTNLIMYNDDPFITVTDIIKLFRDSSTLAADTP